jgi:uncharacterized LabA/DUF88 family protein
VRLAILIDGSNFLAQLDACDLGYPALEPLLERLRERHDLVYARFYSAPQSIDPFRANWQAFRSANRHVAKLDWFQGFRNREGGEKAIDVALAVDLVYGCAYNHFDRAVVIGGDGDHSYAFKVANTIRGRVFVYLMPNQPSEILRDLGVRYRYFRIADLLAWEICERGRQAAVPLSGKAPPGHADITPRLTGANAKLVVQ